MIPRPDSSLERNPVLIELRNALNELDEIKKKKAKIIEDAHEMMKAPECSEDLTSVHHKTMEKQ